MLWKKTLQNLGIGSKKVLDELLFYVRVAKLFGKHWQLRACWFAGSVSLISYGFLEGLTLDRLALAQSKRSLSCSPLPAARTVFTVCSLDFV